MRRAMFAATLGDDIYREDLNVLKLEQKSAQLFEKDAGLFIPSGTMSNLLASKYHQLTFGLTERSLKKLRLNKNLKSMQTFHLRLFSNGALPSTRLRSDTR